MKKIVCYAAILLLTGVVMAACSGSDDLTDNTTSDPQTPTEGNVVVLKGTLGSKGIVTRAIDEYGDGSWDEGDQFAIYYETSNGHASAIATVNNVDYYYDEEKDKSFSSAEFTATLISPKTGDNNVTFVYPATAHDGKGGFKTDALKNQKGTMEYFNKYGDIETAQTTMKVEGVNATLTDNVYMQPQVCLSQIYLYDNDDQDYWGVCASLDATKLEISDGTNSYTVTPADDVESDDLFYVALLPTDNADVTFTATTTKVGSRCVYTKQSVTLDNCTAANVGDVFDKDGNIYSVSHSTGNIIYRRTYSNITLNAAELYSYNELYLSPSAGDGITPVAMIAYVGQPGEVDANSTSFRGLAIAMNPVPDDYYDDKFYWYSDYNSLCPYVGYSNNNTDDYYNFAYHRDCGDMRGIINTEILSHGCGFKNQHDHFAASAARNYSVAGFNPIAIGCSHWFLPSSGQLFKFLKGCGVNPENWNGWQSESETPQGSAADANLVWNKLNVAGVNIDDEFKMWTSSQVDLYSAVSVTCKKNVGITVSQSGKTLSFSVYPFLAFKGDYSTAYTIGVNLKGMGPEESITAF